jgi:hypothetical protein
MRRDPLVWQNPSCPRRLTYQSVAREQKNKRESFPGQSNSNNGAGHGRLIALTSLGIRGSISSIARLLVVFRQFPRGRKNIVRSSHLERDPERPRPSQAVAPLHCFVGALFPCRMRSLLDTAHPLQAPLVLRIGVDPRYSPAVLSPELPASSLAAEADGCS